MKDQLIKAISLGGGQTELARRITAWYSQQGREVVIQQGHVSNWLNRAGGIVPPEHCIAIECVVNEAVTRYGLRPDVFGPAPAHSQTHQQEAA